MLGAIGFEVIGNLAANKTAQANADLEVARANGDAEAEVDALRRIEQWGEGGRNKVLLHGLTGAAVAALSGGDIGGAAAGAAGSELAKDAMIRFLTGQGMDPRSAEFNSLIELASAALGGVIGGSDGAAVALLGDRFNRQLHPDEINFLAGKAEEFAALLFGCGEICSADQVRQARGRLLREAYARVDAIYGDYDSDGAASSFIGSHPMTFVGPDGEQHEGLIELDSGRRSDHSLYKDLLGSRRNEFDLLTTALREGGMTEAAVRLDYNLQLAELATSARGRDGVGILETFSGEIGGLGSFIKSLAQGDGESAGLAAIPLLIATKLPGGKVAAEVAETLASQVVKSAGKKAGANARTVVGLVDVVNNPITGSVQSRINLASGNSKFGMIHIIKQHLSGKLNKSQFSISEAELRGVLQSRRLVSSPIVEVVESKSHGYLYIRRVDMGRIVGSDYLKGNAPTNFITTMSDKYGNIVTAFPGI